MSDRMLVLDDDSERAKWFLSRWPGSIWVQTVETALRELRNGAFNLIFLDHDLGDDCLSLTGYAVACRLADEQLQLPATIVIHSANPVGTERMVQALKATHPNVAHISFPRLRQLVDGGRG